MKMKASELRIGNFVLNDGDVHQIKHGYDIDEAIHQYQPTPLTEEWLLKFGFYEHYSALQISILGGNLKISIAKKTAFITNSDEPLYYLPFPKYVHHLQNLFFCLCGEELTIKHED